VAETIFFLWLLFKSSKIPETNPQIGGNVA
jgi:hypothetical protein